MQQDQPKVVIKKKKKTHLFSILITQQVVSLQGN